VEWILADIDVDGSKRKVAMHFSRRHGYAFYVVETNGSS